MPWTAGSRSVEPFTETARPARVLPHGPQGALIVNEDRTRRPQWPQLATDTTRNLAAAIRERIAEDPLGAFRSVLGRELIPSGDEFLAVCPLHPDNDPSLSVNQEKAVFYCFPCGRGGSLIDLFAAMKCLDRKRQFPEVVHGLAHALGVDVSLAKGETDRRAEEDIQRILTEATDDSGRIADYLKSRGLSGAVPPILRFHPGLPYFDATQGLIGEFPAVVAPVLAPDGEIVAVHRTFLDPRGAGKADVPQPKKLTLAVRPGASRGAAIRLSPLAETLALAEGIETALAVSEATGVPVWSTVSAPGMHSIVVPTGVTTVEIWADGDESGERAAEALATRLHAEGKQVFVLLPRE